ncbi:hypothetical protein HK107_10585 [Parvularcula sp. ZS-1/3]|uniref:Capsule biosynthesis protein n=1 Tax=Parvularcula mediterranea TaxID=2732508 RepID=A0A7Y3RNC9_9PROT|nr:hypothetical protein [Parvularcula mediterranea]NNU16766.1 hypothetical protein [Parvularcula mediterranea]
MHGNIDSTSDQVTHQRLPGLQRPSMTRAEALAFVKKRPFASFFGTCFVLFGLYFGLIHPPVYVAETQFSIRGKDSGPASSSLLSTFIPNSGTGGISESVAVREYIQSPQMLENLNQENDLRSLYARFRIDPLNRLPRSASSEDFLTFYRNRIDVFLDREASILRVRVQSYTAQSAYDMAGDIVRFSENYVNDLSERVREATLDDARTQVEIAQGDVTDIRLAMASFRNTSGELDPAATGAAEVSALIALDADITLLKSQLASQLAINRADAPQVRSIEAQISSLERQAAERRASLASSSEDDTLAALLREYEGLVIDREYAETRLTAAMASLDSARQLANQRERFVVPIVAPTMPTVATEPRRFARFCLAMILSILAYGVVNYTIAGINDHDR